jgi:hypothetical protein
MISLLAPLTCIVKRSCVAMIVIWLGMAAQIGVVAAPPNRSERDQSRFQDRYLFLGTFRASTLRSELQNAAAAGYRVVAGVGQRRLVLEKVASPPDTYQYRFIEPNESFWSSLRQAGAEGFRLVPLVRAWRGDKEEAYEQVFLMERPPGPIQRWTYSEKRLCEESHIVRLTMGPLYFYGHLRNNLLIVETPADTNTPTVSEKIAERILEADKVAKLEASLNDAAAAGDRVIAASDGELGIVIERTSHTDEPCKYRIVAAKRVSTMQRNLNKAGSQGFRLLPAGIGTHMQKAFGFLEGLMSETFGVMQVCPGSSERYEYRLVTNQQELNDASSQHYQAVGMKDFEMHNGAVFLERAMGAPSSGPGRP